MILLHVVKKNGDLIINCILLTKAFIPWTKIIQFEIVTVKLSNHSFISISLSQFFIMLPLMHTLSRIRQNFLKNPRKHWLV